MDGGTVKQKGSSKVNENYVNVLGLMKTDSVLVYGNSLFVGIQQLVNTVSVARKGSDLTKLVKDNSSFHKIIVSKDAVMSEAILRKLVSMNSNLLCFFVDSEDDEQNLKNYLLSNHPWADVWEFNSNVGRVVVTTAKGAPEWLD